MTTIRYIEKGEAFVGQNHPELDDTLNRALRDVLEASLVDPDDPFNGFVVRDLLDTDATASTVVLRDGNGDFAARNITAHLIGTVAGDVTGNVTGNVSGNAGTATRLANARAIGGVSFDGSANITVATATAGFHVSGGALVVDDGLAATPGFAFANDLDTGIMRVAADHLSLVAGGTRTIDVVDGRVGINCAVPTGNAPDLRLIICGGFGDAQPALPDNIIGDVVLLLQRDQFPNPAGVAMAMIAGEDALIRYGSTNGDLEESVATAGMFDFDIVTRAFRFIPFYDKTAYANNDTGRGPGREFLGEKLTVLDEAVLLPPTAIATGTASQANSNDLWLAGSLWSGAEEIHEGMALRVIASTSVNERARLAFLWGTNLESDQQLDAGDRSFAERMAIHGAGYVDFGLVDEVGTIRIDAFTDPERPSIGTANNSHLIFTQNGVRMGGVSTSSAWGFGNMFDWDSVLPAAAFHVFTDQGLVARFQRDGGPAASEGYLNITISDFGPDAPADVILDSAPDSDIALRSDDGDGGAIRIKANGEIPVTGVLIPEASDTDHAGFRLLPGVAPTVPVDGDVWRTATDLKAFVGSTTERVQLGQSVSASVNSLAVPAASTNYTGPGSSLNVSEPIRQFVMPRAVTVSKLRFLTTSTQPANGALVVTVRKNGVDTALTVTIAGGTVAGAFADTTHSVSFAAGDLLSISVANASADTSSAVLSGFSLLFT